MIQSSLAGKTYSLYGNLANSDDYYRRIRRVADRCLARCGSPAELLSVLRALTRSKRALGKIARAIPDSTLASFLAHELRAELSAYTTSVADHLRSLPLAKRWDRTLAASEEQYHLYMMEIELQNRRDVASFRRCDTKLAFLPHCLRDLMADCRSVQRDDDYVCKGCSRACTINAVSKLLRRHGVRPYIWMTANLRTLIERHKKAGKRLGVVGIACIPELVSGMRKCVRADVPVVGIPLDANRCARWWGKFYPNSVNVLQLEMLLGDETLKTPRTL